MSGSFVSTTTSMVVVSSTGVGVVGVFSTSSSPLSSLRAIPLDEPLFRGFLTEPLTEEKML